MNPYLLRSIPQEYWWGLLVVTLLASIVFTFRMRPSRDSGEIKKIRFVTLVGMFLNLILVVCKLVGGVVFYSQALLADAIHSTSDMVTDLVVIFGVKFWSAPPDAQHPYGHGRIETLVSAFIGIALAAAGLFLGIEAVIALNNHTGEVPGMPAFVIALLSIVIKEVLFHWTRKKARELKSPAMEANAWHHRSDAFSSIPVAIAIVIAYIWPSLTFVDSLGAVIVSIFILHAAWKITAGALLELTDAEINAEQLHKIHAVAASVPGVRDVHAVRTRQLGNLAQADLHIMVEPSMTVREGHLLAHKVKKLLLQSDLGLSDVVTHIEPYEPDDPEAHED